MNMSIGQNTKSGELLGSIIGRVEAIRAKKKELNDDEKFVFAEATTQGFKPKTIRKILSIRAQKPHDRQEDEAELDMYMHAMGMAIDAPLFRAVGLMKVDIAARDQVIDAFKQLVPPGGEIIVKIGPQPVRVWRDKDGTAHNADVVESQPEEKKGGAGAKMPERPAPAPVPDVSPYGAEQLGAEAYDGNEPITANPFPFQHPNQKHWDKGWRSASGSDGMGED